MREATRLTTARVIEGLGPGIFFREDFFLCTSAIRGLLLRNTVHERGLTRLLSRHKTLSIDVFTDRTREP